ncbi:hypothetical protein JRQ81_015901, partial [Phrynocephalus forsythii]
MRRNDTPRRTYKEIISDFEALEKKLKDVGAIIIIHPPSTEKMTRKGKGNTPGEHWLYE